MPHIILEYSNNANIKDLTQDFFVQIHNILEQKLPTNLSNCRSRAICHDDFLVGKNGNNNGFIHLQVAILKGRSNELLHNIGTEIMVLMQNHFSKNNFARNIQLSVEIRDLGDVYLKS